MMPTRTLGLVLWFLPLVGITLSHTEGVLF